MLIKHKYYIYMLKIGLTGNKYSGKNTVIKYFKTLNVPVFDADVITRFILNYNSQVLVKVKERFPNNITASGFFDSQKFDTESKIEELLDIIEFDMIEAYNRWLLKHKDEEYTIFKSSVLFERGLNKNFDKIINVFCPLRMRAERYEGTSLAYVNKHTLMDTMRQEMDEYTKNNKSDHVIHNYDTSLSLDTQIYDFHSHIITNYLENRDYPSSLAS